jgi:LysR family hydrogen peroxide-inducible transcriptional activator
MNLRDLKYLIALADYKHFGKAADACNVSQPTLSMQIKKLEEYLQVNLLERSNKQVLITPIGEEIVAKSRDIVKLSEDIIQVAKSSRDPFSGDIKVGAFPTLAPYYFPKIVPKIAKQFDTLKIFLIEEKTEILIEKLKSGAIDMAFLALPVAEDSLEFRDVFEEEFFLAASKQNSIAKDKVANRYSLKNQNLLLLDEGHCLRDQALEFCTSLKIEGEQDFRATSLETLRQMVATNVGITLIPEIARNSNDNIAYIPFEKEKPIRKIALFWRKTSGRKKLFEKIAELSKM